MQFVDGFATILVVMKCLLAVVSFVFLLSGIDDFFIDACFLARAIYRRLFIWTKHRPMSEADLLRHPEQPIAVMIPAWDESAVIRVMLENTLRTLSYSNYYVFVGTYPNDLATQQEVEKVREKNGRVFRIICRDDGPTNKADCLNWIYQGIRAFEKEYKVDFAIFVMQDCEDVVHPLSYKLFNYLIPRKDMVQLPVFPIVPKWTNFTTGHYVDEFAQGHFKDVVVREFLNKSIPAAGVGCAFSRRALTQVAASNHNQVFSLDSLTEDYDFGFRLKEHRLKQVFVKFPTMRPVMKKYFWSKNPRPGFVREYICIRENFPDKFRSAVRQKARWVVGISMQGWANLGWSGDWMTKYMLFRDRKGLITNLVNVLGYVIVLVVLSVWLSIRIDPESYHYPPLLEQGTLLWFIILINAGFLVLRVFQRAFCVWQVYGWQQACLSFPRMVWGNIINCAATGRAIKLYVKYLLTGKLIAWDKTAHSYPSEEELWAYRCKIGDLLLQRQLISVQQLEEGLTKQKMKYQPLGKILREMGMLRDEDLEEVLKEQQRQTTDSFGAEPCSIAEIDSRVYS